MSNLSRILTLICIASIYGVVHAGETWPEQVIHYRSKPTTETLETMVMDRMLLTGSRDIQMDMMKGLRQAEADERYSIAFTSPYNPLVKFGLSVFKANAFSPVLKQSTILKYLKKLSAKVKDKDDAFEILMEPEPDGGRTIFRFLNAKPFSIRYAYTVTSAEMPIKMIRQESWALLDDHYYVVTIEAPEKNFDSFLASVKQPASSMHFIDS